MNTIESSEANELRDRVALVTGGGRGLGRHFALALARCGAKIAVLARSKEQVAETAVLITNMGGRALALTADVTNQVAVEGAVREVEQLIGPVDVLVNNAGSSRAAGSVWEVDPEKWWRDIEINLRGPFLCSRTVLPMMIERHRGRIINVSSAAGLGPRPGYSCYAASKAALICLTDTLAIETKDYDIGIFAISPGTVRTAMTEYLLQTDEFKRWAPWVYNLFQEGRDDPPTRAEQLVVYIASGKADILSGRFINVYDDVTELVRRSEEIRRGDLYTLRLRK